MTLLPQDPVVGVNKRSGGGISFGTFGELLQGVLPEGDTDFLVTLPIQKFTRARLTSDPGRSDLEVFPRHKLKSRRLAQMILDHFQLPAGGVITIESELPEGKGLASSSADLVATARAIEDCFRITVPLELLQQLMARIEPSDGVMYDGAICFYHRKVQRGGYLGSLPPMTIVGTDEGGEVDTIAFNRLPKPYNLAEKAEYGALLEEITRAVRMQDLLGIGKVATRSAVLNQRLQPKRHLEQILQICTQLGGLGVVVAHSGTYVGILFSPSSPRYQAQVKRAQQELFRLNGNAAVFETHSTWEGAVRDVSAGYHRLYR